MERQLLMPGLYADSMQPEILYCDDRVIVCVKPAGVLSTDEPGGMPELLRQALNTEVIKSVHRLDRVTGGIMVYARTRRAASDLEAQIRGGIFHKTYLAVLHGVPQPESGRFSDWLHRDAGQRKSFIVPPGSPQAQRAELAYRVLAENSGLALVGIDLYTGRTHQIRCQFAGHGYPLAGDRKYGGPDENTQLALWACRLVFEHPRDKKQMEFRAAPPLTESWKFFLDTIEKLK